LITSNIDNIDSSDVHPTNGGGATSGLIEGINTAEAVIGHFRNILLYIQSRKEGLNHEGDGASMNETVLLFKDVDVAGPLLKLVK
jgi:vacuolar protein sorting-associated protein 35